MSMLQRKVCRLLTSLRKTVVIFAIVLLLLLDVFIINPLLKHMRHEDKPRSYGFNKLFAAKFKNKSLATYTPKNFYALDQALVYPVLSKKEPETVACDNYLGRPNGDSLDVDRWQFIDSGEYNETYVYSAYYDPREAPAVIKIHGMSSGVSFTSDLPLKYCYVWFEGRERPDVMVAHYSIIPETHDKIYAASVHICALNRKRIPVFVALSNQRCKEQKRFLKVINNSRYIGKPLHNFTLCVTPLNFDYNNVGQLIESIEINRLFGANHFTFYNYTSGLLIPKALKTYIDEGLVEVLDWSIPVNVDTRPSDPTVEVEIHYFGQLVSLNDCLYRNMFRSKFIVFSDLDELIVPQLHENWFEMIRHATAETLRKQILIQDVDSLKIFPASYLIKNIFLPLQWKQNNMSISMNERELEEFSLMTGLSEDALEEAAGHRLNSLFVTRCECKTYSWYIRSKYIVWSQVTDMVAVHQALSFICSISTMQVNVRGYNSLLYHYREWEDGGQTNSKSQSCSRLHHFLPKYLPKVLEKLKSLNVNNL